MEDDMTDNARRLKIEHDISDCLEKIATLEDGQFGAEFCEREIPALNLRLSDLSTALDSLNA